MDHLFILNAIKELPFPVGKKFLSDFLQGAETESIKRHRLNKLDSFGTMAYEDQELRGLIDSCMFDGLIKQTQKSGTYFKVINITEKGEQELINPQKRDTKVEKTEITDEDKHVFETLDFFLDYYDDEQKKAIITNKRSVLCVAGAGSGKTSVLTKRIEFLMKFRSAEKILAITFTRKAREEMQSRLALLGVSADVETFNSFCEKLLRKNEHLKEKGIIISYKEKIQFVKEALENKGLTFDSAINLYFTASQKKNKGKDVLLRTLVNDCYSILDQYKNNGEVLQDFTNEEPITQIIYDVCKFVEEKMKENKRRDFSDQLIDCKSLFEQFPEVIPQYEHILVDEFQDVNKVQMEILKMLKPENLFCVGDPRQAIYGWRGARLEYITNFNEHYEDTETIYLVNNYRSSKHIVTLMNNCIKGMRLPGLKSRKDFDKFTDLLSFQTEESEIRHIVDDIKKSSETNIFILSRTNKQLEKIVPILEKENIPYIIKTEDSMEEKDNAVTLATVHAIKGLEADKVYVIGANLKNYPCKTSDHPIFDYIKVDYNKFEEELRLFYVAISRARKSLVISYTGSMSYFITDEMRKEFGQSESSIILNLKNWRALHARKQNVPAYFIMKDDILEEIAARRPDKKELEKMIGPLKVMKYGRELMELI